MSSNYTRAQRQRRYRTGEETLPERDRKKLLESTNWYKKENKKNVKETETIDILRVSEDSVSRKNWKVRNSYIKNEVSKVCKSEVKRSILGANQS